MTSNPQRTFKATALLLVLSIFQVFVIGVSAAPATPQGGLTGKLRTTRNQSVTVNGNSTSSGHTIFPGATIETPSGVGATINLDSLGSVDLSPNTRVELTFSDGEIKLMLIKGCAIVRTRQGTYGEINTAQGKATSNDPVRKEAATLDVCNPEGAPAPIVGQGAAANAGAGAAAATVATVGTTAGSVGTLGVIIGGAGLVGLMAAAIIVPCRRGKNPSPGVPPGKNDECRN